MGIRNRVAILIATGVFVLPAMCRAQGTKRGDLARLFTFEGQQTPGGPLGWSGTTGTIFADDKVVHSGKWAARIERDAASANQFSTITIGIPIDFSGTRIEFRGFLKSKDVSNYFGLWMREDGDSGSVGFESMQSRQIKGTHDWAEYAISLPLSKDAKQLFFGVLSAGTGKTWADDLQILVDAKPVWDLPVVEKPKTPLDLDHEFDRGSGITLTDLSKTQIDNLATLGKVWGFLKYHHPAITSGQRHWDYDLFRILPSILAAADRTTVNTALHNWIASLGTVTECTATCASLTESDLYMKPDLDWIADEKLLGTDLSRDLQRIHRNRSAVGNSFFVSQARGVGNPQFDHEPNYARVTTFDAGFQLLGLYRFWNIINYWYPNRDIIGESWEGVLAEFIPRIALAKTSASYQLEMMALIARIHDTHANLWSSLSVRPPVGDCQIPVVIRFAESSAVISGWGQAEPVPDLKIGDVILELDGTPVSELVSRWTPYYADSNDPVRLRDIARAMTRGSCGMWTLRIRRDGRILTVNVPSVAPTAVNQRAGSTHDLAGDTFRKLSDDVAYLKLSSVKTADAARYVDSAKGTKGLIIDIRNYPSEFMVFSLGSLLVDKPTEFSRFTFGDLSNPGAFHWGKPLSLTPQQPHYNGKVIVLVDEVSQSQAEYTTMAFRAAGAIVIGSTTAGADGDVSQIPLPGGLSSMLSGIGVYYPDKKPTQRLGIVPDIEVNPTIAGIRDGRDEVLEEALRQIAKP